MATGSLEKMREGKNMELNRNGCGATAGEKYMWNSGIQEI
jgi:hypothetical protein